MPRRPKYKPYHLTLAEGEMVRGGRRGGRRTVKRYGVEYMRKIGRRGGRVFVARYIASGSVGLAAINGDEDAIACVKKFHTPPPPDDLDDPEENEDWQEE
jgi:general stress protein YciG